MDVYICFFVVVTRINRFLKYAAVIKRRRSSRALCIKEKGLNYAFLSSPRQQFNQSINQSNVHFNVTVLLAGLKHKITNKNNFKNNSKQLGSEPTYLTLHQKTFPFDSNSIFPNI